MISARILFIVLSCFLITEYSCTAHKKSSVKPFDYGRAPKNYQAVIDDYQKYNRHSGCEPGETIASIGAGNGLKEVQISCFVEGINWFLEEIDSSKLYQFDQVLKFHEALKGAPIKGEFELVLGSELETSLPKGTFDRVLLINVYHELSNKEPMMKEIQELLKPYGELVIMERMGDKSGLVHKDCKHPKLYEPELLSELRSYEFEMTNINMVEKMSNLTFYTFRKQ